MWYCNGPIAKAFGILQRKIRYCILRNSQNVFVDTDTPKNVLAEVIANAGLKQMHVAETEKFAHVTKFFNGGRHAAFE